ncbi:MAG: ethylbenzene dehydrogenase-related protein [Hyphomicrobiales bacterium]
MFSERVTSLDRFFDPGAAGWAGVSTTSVEMVPAPLGLQPNEYIQVSWEDRDYGALESLDAKSVHDGAQIAIWLSWAKAKPDTGGQEGFPDSAALAFPIADVPDITSMGTPKAPIHLLHWMARKNALRAVVAQGIGSSMEGADVAQSVKAGWTQGRWSVVFTRSLIAGKQAVSLVPGTQSQIGFAVWDGSNEERAGIKAVSADWTDFQIKE